MLHVLSENNYFDFNSFQKINYSHLNALGS